MEKNESVTPPGSKMQGETKMILSVSRRTDIPNYYSDWFYHRIKERFLYVRNPINPHQVSKLDLSPDVVDCIVFWTKNPEPMMDRLNELSRYKYYFQFTLTGYGADMEKNVPHKREKMIPIFQTLSQQIGSRNVIWRYDPIIFTKKYSPEYHLKAFAQIAQALNGYTHKCIISFVDIYRKNQKNMKTLDIFELSDHELMNYAQSLHHIASQNGMTVGSCAEHMDLQQCGIEHNCCIDKTLIEEILGCKISAGKDKNQRAECGCVESVDVGIYDTCLNGCKYCYANYSEERIARTRSMYDRNSPLLCGRITPEDRVREREMKSVKVLEEQMELL